MIVNPARPKRPALRYYGGKFLIAPWIISHFPQHVNYCEPCCGGASVIMAKPPSTLETINDIDGDVVNFFRVLRDRPDELVRLIRLTPWARAEYEACARLLAHGPDLEPVERARAFWVVSWMSFNGATRKGEIGSSWRFSINGLARRTSPASDGINIEHLYLIAGRLKEIQIDARDWAECFKKYDNADTLTYMDPPDLLTTRNNRKAYAYEWDDTDHEKAAEILRAGPGFVIVSGYASDLYADCYESHGWKRVDNEPTQTNSGGKRVESLWLNPATVQALEAERLASQRQPLLFPPGPETTHGSSV